MKKVAQSVSIIMLVYNEAEIIEEVLRDYCTKVVSKLDDIEFLVAEDGSTDGTKEILARLKNELPITLVQGAERKGYVKAFKDAMALPKKDVIFFTDSSGKHDPDDFWKMVPFIGKYDIVNGFKIKRKDPFYRVIITKAFNMLVNLYFKINLKDIDCGFKLIKREAMQDILKDEWIATDLISFEIMVRMLYRGYSVKEVAISHRKRANGESRGLPTSKIPKVVVKILKDFKNIRSDAKRCAMRK